MSIEILLASVGFGLITASILGMAAVGFTLQFSVTGVLNLAYADVMTVAAFVSLLLNTLGWSIWATIPIAGATGAIVSLLINRGLVQPLLRRGTGLFGMLIATLALSMILWNGLLAIVRPGFFKFEVGPSTTFRFFGQILTTSQLAIMGLAVLTLTGVHVLMRYTRLGKAMRAVSANPDLARACGIPARPVVDLVWVISGFLSGMAGVALFMSVPAFDTTTGRHLLVVILATVMLGGVGNVYGSLLAAIVIGLAGEFVAAAFAPQWRDVFALLVLIAVLGLRPTGILRETFDIRTVAAA